MKLKQQMKIMMINQKMVVMVHNLFLKIKNKKNKLKKKKKKKINKKSKTQQAVINIQIYYMNLE